MECVHVTKDWNVPLAHPRVCLLKICLNSHLIIWIIINRICAAADIINTFSKCFYLLQEKILLSNIIINGRYEVPIKILLIR